jgi:sulfite reductase alpha subunit-like flavoprotein
LIPIFKNGGKVYICGSPALAEGVKKCMVRIWSERKGKSEEEGLAWLESLGRERFATDVFV